MNRRVVFLGFDAGNKYLIQEWAKAGIMPTFRALLAKGLRGNTLSLPGLFVGATWPSFMTGCTPGKHGVHSWEQLRPGTYDFYRCYTGEQLSREPFWNHLSRAGRRVAVLDVPLSPGVTKNLNGMQSVEYGFHDAQYGFMTWPPPLAQEIVARFGPYPVEGTCNADRGTREYAQFRDDLVRGVGTKTAVTRHFLRSEDWNFFAQVFTESHCVGHQCWHLHDPNHPRHDPEQARIVGDPMRDVYCAIDTAIGEVLNEVDANTTVVVLASHGMGYKYGPQFLLDQILLRLNVAAPAIKGPEPAPRLRDRIDPFLTWSWQRIPENVRARLQPARQGLRHWIDKDQEKALPRTIDLQASQCFPIQNNSAHGGVRVNLIGREPNGKVAPGADYESFCAQLIRDLMDIVDLDSGKRVVARIVESDDLYRGEYRDHLPDLLVEWASDRPVSAIRIGSDRIGEISGAYRFCRTGDHFPGGMFIAYGPGIEPGVLGRTVSIMDFAPTFAQLLEAPLPDVDGRPITEIVTPARAVQPV